MSAVGSFLYNHSQSQSLNSTKDGFSATWQRSFSAGDIVGMRRTPKRRPFDAVQPPADLLSPSSQMEVMTPTHHNTPCLDVDPGERINKLSYSSRIGDTFSPTNQGSRQDRALDNWPLGEGMRIMHHIQPKKYRAISQRGDCYQGFWRTDWQDVTHIQALRSKYPASQQDVEHKSIGPFPQGMTQEELRKNRNFNMSHGGRRNTGGLVQVGGQFLIP
ncbi:unnamed protein product [Polarella glacialis]|uniref:Uncharacterized protein n=1 Tax=Polarella glacialis TaxID=89957 RepID=A0A813KZX4_POLGL|nr:unnamed protein product [Polarella glacialis]CAE8712138.1 unnamed protein product [Polarella glacialis]